MKPSFIATMRKVFGLKEGQGAMDFMNEIRALSTQDRVEFSVLLTAAGYEHQPPAGS